MVSLGVIVYMLALAVPRVSKPEESSLETNTTGKIKLGAAHALDKVDGKLKVIKDKTLRRLKVSIMRVDNFISKQLNNEKDKI